MSYDFNSYQQDTLEKPRDKAWDNWAKFENVGDSVQGFIRDVFYRPVELDDDGREAFSAQRGITLEQPGADKILINVGIKQIDFILAKTNDLRLDDPLTIVFEKEIPNSDKRKNPTKVFGFYGKNLEENLSNPSVFELETKDKGEAAAAQQEQSPEEEVPTPESVSDSELPFESPVESK